MTKDIFFIGRIFLMFAAAKILKKHDHIEDAVMK